VSCLRTRECLDFLKTADVEQTGQDATALDMVTVAQKADGVASNRNIAVPGARKILATVPKV